MNKYLFENNQQNTKHRILDEAEHLFARKGFQGTTLRAITSKAGVNLAAVNYHFGTKEALLEAVLERRLIPLNKVRKERLEKVRDTAREQKQIPSVKNLLLAFVEPTLDFKESSPGAEDFITLVGRSFSDPDDTVRKVFLRLVWPMFHLLFDTFHEALSELSEEVLLWRLHFMFGAFAHTMHIFGGRFQSDLIRIPTDINAEKIIEMFIPFISAGMEAK